MGDSGNCITEKPTPARMMTRENGLPRIAFAACRHLHQRVPCPPAIRHWLCNLCRGQRGHCESSSFPVSFCNAPVRLARLSGSLQQMSTKQPQSPVSSLLSTRKPGTQQVGQRDTSELLSNPPTVVWVMRDDALLLFLGALFSVVAPRQSTDADGRLTRLAAFK